MSFCFSTWPLFVVSFCTSQFSPFYLSFFVQLLNEFVKSGSPPFCAPLFPFLSKLSTKYNLFLTKNDALLRTIHFNHQSFMSNSIQKNFTLAWPDAYLWTNTVYYTMKSLEIFITHTPFVLTTISGNSTALWHRERWGRGDDISQTTNLNLRQIK